MRLDAPRRLLGALLADVRADRGDLVNVVANYLDIRSAARGVGHLPTVPLEALAPAVDCLIPATFGELPVYLGGDDRARVPVGGMSLREARALVALLCLTRARTIVEFGTSYGDGALLLAANAPQGIVYTTDWPERPEVGAKIRGRPLAGRIAQSYDKTTDWDLTALAGAIDFAFVDASHTYADVRADSVKLLPLLAPGGVIVWHDYRFKFRADVVRALDELRRDRDVLHIKHTALAVYRQPTA